MSLICEVCGKEIIAPNYIVDSFQDLYNSYYECALCNLEYQMDAYMEFKDEAIGLSFHEIQLAKINALNFELLSFKTIN